MSQSFNEGETSLGKVALKVALPGARMPVMALSGVMAAAVATLAYTFEQRAFAVATQGETSGPDSVAILYLAVMSIAILAVVVDTRRLVASSIAAVRSLGLVPNSPRWLVPYVLSVRRYRRCFFASATLYAAFYAIITSMIVYQPTVNFAQTYGVSIPSAILTPRGAPLFAPDLVVYLPEHVGVQLIPLTVILLITISVLVGVNLALSVFAFDSRAKGEATGLTGALGAIVGLFTGCPTCAGLFFANTLGGSGAASFAALLGYYQPAFILLSVPVLLAAPYLTSRSLAKVYRDGCVTLGQKA